MRREGMDAGATRTATTESGSSRCRVPGVPVALLVVQRGLRPITPYCPVSSRRPSGRTAASASMASFRSAAAATRAAAVSTTSQS
jgi:hypothetical protein